MVDKYDYVLYRYFTNLLLKSIPPTGRTDSLFRASRIYSLQTMLLGMELVLSRPSSKCQLLL